MNSSQRIGPNTLSGATGSTGPCVSLSPHGPETLGRPPAEQARATMATGDFPRSVSPVAPSFNDSDHDGESLDRDYWEVSDES